MSNRFSAHVASFTSQTLQVSEGRNADNKFLYRMQGIESIKVFEICVFSLRNVIFRSPFIRTLSTFAFSERIRKCRTRFSCRTKSSNLGLVLSFFVVSDPGLLMSYIAM